MSQNVAEDDTNEVGGEYTPPGQSPELPDPLDPVALEAAGVTIGEVIIKSQNVFDLDNPLEDKWLYRLANKLHIVTKPHVIESQLLFSEGDAFSARLANESERILRRNSYLREADVVPIKVEDGVVDVAPGEPDGLAVEDVDACVEIHGPNATRFSAPGR